MGAAFSVIAGKRWKSYLVYEVNSHAKLVWRHTYHIGDAKKIDESGPGNGAEVARIASPSAIRRSARRCCSLLSISSGSMYDTFVCC